MLYLGGIYPPVPSVLAPVGATLQGALPALAALEGFVRALPVVAQFVEGVVQIFFLPILLLLLLALHRSPLVP